MQRGFTLVELAIVIVIIGLLVGGVLAGQNIIRSSEVNSTITLYNAYKGYTELFRDGHDYLPGDYPFATEIWGERNATPSTCETMAAVGKLTCDGNGDRIITTGPGGSTLSERYLYYQHLANAGYIDQEFTGMHGPGGVAHVVAGVNVPALKVRNGAMNVTHRSCVTTANPHYFLRCYGHILLLGRETSSSANWDPIYTTREAFNIDSKFDDGSPVYGEFSTLKAGSSLQPDCVTTAVESTSEYDIADNEVKCVLFGVISPER